MRNIASFHNTSMIAVPAISVQSLTKRLSGEIEVMEKQSPQTAVERMTALILLIILSPVLVVVALFVRTFSGGPIFFTQERVGYNGKVFKILKFRTMISDAENKTGPTLSWQGDPRVTPIGRILRASHIDEFPQLLNIVRGEMSFIGPRPERLVFTTQFQKEFPSYRLRERVLPGITGLAQVLAPYDAKPHEKLLLDMKYIRDESVALRMKILWLTFLALIGMRQQWQVESVDNFRDVLDFESTDLLRGVASHVEAIMAD